MDLFFEPQTLSLSNFLVSWARDEEARSDPSGLLLQGVWDSKGEARSSSVNIVYLGAEHGPVVRRRSAGGFCSH